jgi:tetratricopeptide (TPR) repeat protein
MKARNMTAMISCLLLGVAAVAYCVAQKKHSPPQIRERTVVIRPFSPELQARDNKYEQYLEEGDKALAADPALAEGYYQKASSLIAYRPDAWLGLARARDAQGKSTQALPAYRQAFNPPSGSGLYSSFPSDVASLARYGALCAENGQQEEAMKVYTQAGDRLNPKPDVPLGAAYLSPQNLRARLEMVRGIALAEAKEHSGEDRDKEALEAFQKAAHEQPDDPQVQFYLGYGLRKAGRFAQSQAAFQKAATLDTEGTIKGATEENLRAVQAHRK